MKNPVRQAVWGALGAILAFGLLAAAQAADPKPPGRAPVPAIMIERPGKCVEPADEMRRNHMNMILHQRDRTVHEGIRSVKHSLKNCIDCHASTKTNSVLGPDGFCESCHSYAAVRIDCFECHSPSPRKAAGGRTPAVSRWQAPPQSVLRAAIAAAPDAAPAGGGGR